MSSTSLNSAAFKALFQAAHQTFELPDTHLPALGCTSQDVSRLIETLSAARPLLSQSSTVNFTVDDKLVGTDAAVVATSESGNDVSIRLSNHAGTVWLNLLQHLLSTMSPREIFLRTGYQQEEVREAIDQFARVQDA
ncbi:hypothetical protein [Streptomyces sp. NPDC017940]|uniref:hypothetical protein n=1 Tax=Streptomyces sp. NPDC017940 TaxID=3365017 RepID=UPI00378F5D63